MVAQKMAKTLEGYFICHTL